MRPQRTENRVRNWATSMLMIVSLFHPGTVAVVNDERRPGPSSYGLEHDVRNAGHRTVDDHGLPFLASLRDMP
ncbi:hypothetical protein ARMSODRAFT_188441 [Armillaria solidipes]|uniref:Uncharacterized protein n=1 Tax=Armillaria solidipes TaxID=1076256 RepID=A0A2H3BCW7_9AGAR|nr:hypothetical protein ARMSODRAFT_188441 [Armillaria solidipes]